MNKLWNPPSQLVHTCLNLVTPFPFPEEPSQIPINPPLTKAVNHVIL